MKKLNLTKWITMAVTLMVVGPGFGQGSVWAVETPAQISADDIEILASGPIHEAFAEAVALDPEPGIEAPQKPPALIEELPPDEKPEGDVQWIPGYWGWDDEKEDYLWISGIWRVPPPGRQWVPGYWNQTGSGYQWISGYWAGMEEQATEYLPEPPESVEVGPSSNAPSPEHTWIPGCWVWHHGRYAWQTGYWAAVQPDWIWVPAHHRWTPRGYVFVSGYWDYSVTHRGILFAPVFFGPRVFLGPAFVFTPGFVIHLGIFDDALFLRPRYRHYYFGDYYAPHHYRRGIYPWFSLHARRRVYDPIYAHQRWHHRHDRTWERRLETTFRERREHKELRPSRSYNPRTDANPTRRTTGYAGRDYVIPLKRVKENPAGTYRFKPLSNKERRDFTQRQKAVRTYGSERQQRETINQSGTKARGSEKAGPDREKISRSPIADRPDRNRDSNNTPPTRYTEPKPNPNVEPLERKINRTTRTTRPNQLQGQERQRAPSNGDRPSSGKNRGGSDDRRKKTTDKQRDGNGRRER